MKKLRMVEVLLVLCMFLQNGCLNANHGGASANNKLLSFFVASGCNVANFVSGHPVFSGFFILVAYICAHGMRNSGQVCVKDLLKFCARFQSVDDGVKRTHEELTMHAQCLARMVHEMETSEKQLQTLDTNDQKIIDTQCEHTGCLAHIVHEIETSEKQLQTLDANDQKIMDTQEVQAQKLDTLLEQQENFAEQNGEQLRRLGENVEALRQVIKPPKKCDAATQCDMKVCTVKRLSDDSFLSRRGR